MVFEPAEWRLIVEELPRSGAANMAMDQAIADACADGNSLPTLRFYRWDPPAISLGRHQKFSDVDTAAVRELGYDIVRRPTGGRAILHTDELTYSVSAPANEPHAQGSVMDAYLRLSNALLVGLLDLGLEADKAPGSVRAGPDASAACFEAPSAYEITFGGRKLLGSAQSRRAGYVLQHGSLPLVGDIGRLVDVLALPPAERTSLRADLHARACTVADALRLPEDDASVQFDAVVQALINGFSQTLNLTLKPGRATSDEIRNAALLIRTQYANPEWTERH